MSIAWDGRVLLCCGDLNGRVVLGDLKVDDAKQIWLGKSMCKLRQAMGEHRNIPYPICNSCDALWRGVHPLIGDAASLRFAKPGVAFVRSIKNKLRKAQRSTT